MSTWTRVVICALLTGCHHTPTARERSLDQLPGASSLVIAADGPVLASPAFRRVIDRMRPEFPASLGCVIDAALEADAVALAADRNRGATIVIVGRLASPACPALGKIGPDVWVATLGGASVAPKGGSVRVDPRWVRARSYLETAPVGLALDTGDRHVIGALQISPVEGWLTIDAADADAVERDVRARLAAWHTHLEVSRAGAQILVHAGGLDDAALETVATDLRFELESAPPAPEDAQFTCPPPSDLVVRCSDHTDLVVHTIADALRAMSARAEPVVASSEVIGIRLMEDAPLMLHEGDVILAIDSHRITSSAELEAKIHEVRGHGHVAVAVRRGATEAVIDLGAYP